METQHTWCVGLSALLLGTGLFQLSISAPANAAIASTCQYSQVIISDATSAESAEACRALADVVGYFQKLQFSFEPAFSIRVRSSMSTDNNEGRRSHGFFDSSEGTVVLFRSSNGAPWGLDWSQDLANSFLRHELVHVSLWHILGDDFERIRPEWHEFIAYAIQFDLMNTQLREQILANNVDIGPFSDLANVNEFTHGMAPDNFAISSYRTYLSRGSGTFINRLLTFEIRPPPMAYPFVVLPSEISSQ